MDLTIACSGITGPFDVFGSNILATLLHLARDSQQSLQLLRDAGVFEVAFHITDQLVVIAQVRCCNRAMDRLAVVAIVP